MPQMYHYAATNDPYGNPRRAYVLEDSAGTIVAAWDESYKGALAVPGVFRDKAARAPMRRVTVRKYREVLEKYPSPKHAHEIHGYEHTRAIVPEYGFANNLLGN